MRYTQRKTNENEWHLIDLQIIDLHPTTIINGKKKKNERSTQLTRASHRKSSEQQTIRKLPRHFIASVWIAISTAIVLFSLELYSVYFYLCVSCCVDHSPKHRDSISSRFFFFCSFVLLFRFLFLVHNSIRCCTYIILSCIASYV